jgi:O-antigen/teichoic acid export membrane protein
LQFSVMNRTPEQRQSLKFIAVSTLAYGISVVTGPLVARGVGEAQRGEVAIAMVVLTTSWYLSDAGAASAYLCGKFRSSTIMRAAWAWSFLVTIPPALLLALATGLLFPNLPSGVLWWMRIGILLTPLNAAARVAQELYLVRRGIDRPLLWISHLNHYLNAAVIVCLVVFASLDAKRVVACLVLSIFVQTFVGLTVFHGWLAPRRGPVLKELNAFKVKELPATVADLSVARLDQLVMSRLVSTSELGHYAVAANVTVASNALTAALNRLIFAKVATKRNDVGSVVRWSKIAIALSFMLNCTAAACVPFVLPAVFGQAYRSSIGPARILLAAQFFFDSSSILMNPPRAMGFVGRVTRVRLWAAAFTAICIIPAVKLTGITGAAWVTLGTSVISLVLATRLARDVHREVHPETGQEPRQEPQQEPTTSKGVQK